MSAINQVIDEFGTPKIGRACGVSGEAVRKWGIKGCLPRTEYTGETRYAELISELSDGKFTVESLLARPDRDSAA